MTSADRRDSTTVPLESTILDADGRRASGEAPRRSCAKEAVDAPEQPPDCESDGPLPGTERKEPRDWEHE